MGKILFFCNSEKKDFELYEYYNQDIVALRELGYDIVFATNYLEVILKFYKVDFIFIWWWTYAFLPVFIGKIFCKPTIITGTFNFKFDVKSANSGNDYFDRPFYQKILIRYSVKNANLNLFVNKNEKDACSDYFNLSNAEYFPHIIPSIYFNEPKKNREEYILNISWSGKSNLVRKGIFNLIKSFSEISHSFPNLKLILAGKKGDGYHELENVIRNLNLQDRVILKGEISLREKIDLLTNSLLYVQPSLFEGFGVAIGEAMASGVCVISCEVGGVPSLLGNAGIYVKPNDINDLTEKLFYILSSKEDRIYFESLAFNKAMSDLNPSSKILKLESFLKKINS